VKKKRVLVVCPTQRDKRELACIQAHHTYDIIFHDYDPYSREKITIPNVGWFGEKFDPAAITRELIETCATHHIDGIFSTQDYPGSIFVPFIARHTQLYGPTPQASLLCHHKYFSRQVQQQYVPEATPTFALVENIVKTCPLSLPAFIKPVKANFSMLASAITTQEQMRYAIQHYSLPIDFLNQFNWFVAQAGYQPYKSSLLVEELLSGVQVTLEGFISQGEITIIGIVDSIFYPATICFERFDYPSELPDSVQERMHEITKRCIRAIGLDNTLFNIEFMYNPTTDAIHIIEINPRMASQFADLYEKVHGTNSYHIALTLAVGEKPCMKRSGNYAIAASCVLRVFEDYFVQSIPTNEQMQKVYKEFPDVRVQICAQPGVRLSEGGQDGKSFRYAVINLGAETKQELFHNLERCKQLLPFDFIP